MKTLSNYEYKHWKKLYKKSLKKLKNYEGGGNMVTQYDKALVALLVPLAVLIFKHFNFPIDQGVQDAVGVLITGFLVWLVPNK